MSPVADYDEPFEFGQVRPSVDRPGPFSVRQLVRLQLLRTRIEAGGRGRNQLNAFRG